MTKRKLWMYLDEDMEKYLTSKAEEKGVTRNILLAQICEEYIEKEKSLEVDRVNYIAKQTMEKYIEMQNLLREMKDIMGDRNE